MNSKCIKYSNVKNKIIKVLAEIIGQLFYNFEVIGRLLIKTENPNEVKEGFINSTSEYD